MEKVTTLKREKTTRTFSKLKINTNERLDKIIDRIIKFISRDLNETDLSNFSEYLKFNNFKISKIEELPDSASNKIRNTFYKKDRENFYQAYTITFEDSNTKHLDILTNALDISPRARKSMWKVLDFKMGQRICDIKYIYSMFKLLDITYEYCISNKEILDKDFKNVSIYGNYYTEEDVKKLINLDHIMGIRSTFGISTLLKRLIVDVILIKQSSDYNIELMERYSRDIQSEVARAFETKKNIPQKIMNVMNNNKFLENFSYVELDQDTDLSKFKLVEDEFIRIRRIFDMGKIKKAELRVRKLGKHKALGLYYPTLKCLCVDITSPESFMHEFGHHLDYNSSDKPLSLQFNFRPVIVEYTNLFDKQREEDEYLSRKRNYFITPTEIFARTFEMYLVNKGVNTSFLKEKEAMIINRGYPKMDDNSMKIINSYFDSFNLNFKILSEEEAVKNEIQDTFRKIIIEEIQYKKLQQVSFF